HLREPARVVRRVRDRHLVVADLHHVGVMVPRRRDRADPRHEAQRIAEPLEREGLADRLARPPPARQVPQARVRRPRRDPLLLQVLTHVWRTYHDRPRPFKSKGPRRSPWKPPPEPPRAVPAARPWHAISYARP